MNIVFVTGSVRIQNTPAYDLLIFTACKLCDRSIPVLSNRHLTVVVRSRANTTLSY